MSATVKKKLVSLFLGPLFPGKKIRMTGGISDKWIYLAAPTSAHGTSLNSCRLVNSWKMFFTCSEYNSSCPVVDLPPY